MDTLLLGKAGEFSGAQDAWRNWSPVFRDYADAAVPRLQKLTVEAAKAKRHDPASAQLYWIMLMICKGAALNIVLLTVKVSRRGDNGRKIRAEDENTFCRTTDVHLVILTSGRPNESLPGNER